jgi:hypothetical protein
VLKEIDNSFLVSAKSNFHLMDAHCRTDYSAKGMSHTGILQFEARRVFHRHWVLLDNLSMMSRSLKTPTLTSRGFMRGWVESNRHQCMHNEEWIKEG